MNILLLTGLYDTKPASGGGALMRSYVLEMRKQGHKVILLYYTSADADPRSAATEEDTYYLPDLINEVAADRPLLKKVLIRLRRKLIDKPVSRVRAERYFQRDMSWLKDVLKDVLRNTHVDVVQVDFPWMMKAIDHIPKHLPTVFVSHEAQFVMYNRNGETALAERSAELETNLARKYSAVLTLTDVEAAAWKKVAPDLNVQVSVMGVDLPNNALELTTKATKLVFVGSGKHLPNIEGIRYFLLEVWPLVKQANPEVELYITGQYNDLFVEEFSDLKHVNWVGFVPSLAELMQGAISIVPIRSGSGIRVKILESMAFGAAVVSTEMAAEGIAVSDRENILLANDALGFASAVSELLSDSAMYATITANAKHFVADNYDLSVSSQKRSEILGKIIRSAKA